MTKFGILSLSVLAAMLVSACKKGDDSSSYTVPTTYGFANVNDSAQIKLLLMADQIVNAVNTANVVPNHPVSAQQLKDMFNNTGYYFNDSALALNSSGLRLADYCAPAATADMMTYFDSVGAYSQSTATAAPGIAGVAASTANASKKYLLSPNGIFYSQLIKKTLQGGLCGYQIITKINSLVDNNTVVAGTGTALEHAWDEAFGFFGVPVDFPSNTSGLKYWGSYSNQVDPGLHSNASIMSAFLKGRAAISAKDMNTRDQQAAILTKTFDRLCAAAIVQEMKETDANIDAGDAVAAYGTMSEAISFIRDFKYNTNSNRQITDAQILQLEKLIDNDNPSNPNLYNFIGANISSPSQIKAKTDAIRQLIGTIYGFSATDLALL